MEKLKEEVLAHLRLLVLLFIVGIITVTVTSLHEWLAKPAVRLPEPISSREIIRGDTSKQQVIFTFDGGSGAQSADKILEILARHHAKGTFFLTGKFVEANPDLVRKMVRAGHEIFNHTYDHPHLTEMSDGHIDWELDKMAETLQNVAGISPKPYFRPPYGDRNSRVRRVAAMNGYQSVYWTIDAGDWEQSMGKTANQVRQTILGNLSPGAIYLMHLGDDLTGEILDDIFTTIESRGYKIVSLTQGL